LAEAGLDGGRAVIGVEPSLARLAQDVVAEAAPAAELRDASAALEQARSRKTSRELALLREAALVASAAPPRLLAPARASSLPVSDVDVWIELMRAMEARTSQHLTVTGELVTG